MATISELLRRINDGEMYYAPATTQVTVGQAADTIDSLVGTLNLVKSMRTVDALSPAEHEFEQARRREAWERIDSEISAALALARGEG